jgi:hypothetical protein
LNGIIVLLYDFDTVKFTFVPQYFVLSFLCRSNTSSAIKDGDHGKLLPICKYDWQFHLVVSGFGEQIRFGGV